MFSKLATPHRFTISLPRTHIVCWHNMSNILSAKDANAAMATGQENAAKPDVKSMEYHRQMLQNKIQKGGYVVTQANPVFRAK